MFMTVGERVSGTYCGTLLSRERLGLEEAEEGQALWVNVRLEAFDRDDAVLRRDVIPVRREPRGIMLEESPASPPRLPISVEVRSIEATPGAEDRRSCCFAPGPAPACC